MSRICILHRFAKLRADLVRQIELYIQSIFIPDNYTCRNQKVKHYRQTYNVFIINISIIFEWY